MTHEALFSKKRFENRFGGKRKEPNRFDDRLLSSVLPNFSILEEPLFLLNENLFSKEENWFPFEKKSQNNSNKEEKGSMKSD
jgi:hypothetical protein